MMHVELPLQYREVEHNERGGKKNPLAMFSNMVISFP